MDRLVRLTQKSGLAALIPGPAQMFRHRSGARTELIVNLEQDGRRIVTPRLMSLFTRHASSISECVVAVRMTCQSIRHLQGNRSIKSRLAVVGGSATCPLLLPSRTGDIRAARRGSRWLSYKPRVALAGQIVPGSPFACCFCKTSTPAVRLFAPPPNNVCFLPLPGPYMTIYPPAPIR